jgi:hypothetical protein
MARIEGKEEGFVVHRAVLCNGRHSLVYCIEMIVGLRALLWRKLAKQIKRRDRGEADNQDGSLSAEALLPYHLRNS